MASEEAAKKSLDDLLGDPVFAKDPNFNKDAGKKPAGRGNKPDTAPASKTGDPHPATQAKPDSQQSNRTPEQAVQDKVTLREKIADVKNDLTASISETGRANLKKTLSGLETQLEELLKQFPDAQGSAQSKAVDTTSLQQTIAMLRDQAKQLGDAGKPLSDRADELQKQLSASKSKPAEAANTPEPAKPAEAPKPEVKKVELTPEQESMIADVSGANLTQNEKESFIGAIKGAKDAASLASIQNSLQILRDL